MLVRQMKVGLMQNFVYILADEPSKEALAIDSGWETGPIVAAAKEKELEVKFVVATHHHPDHTATIWELARTLDAKVVAHRSSPYAHDISVSGGGILQIGNRKVRILHTPGHTEDSICVYDGKNLFTGDTLFIGDCGRTDLSGGSPMKMFESLHCIILKLPPETTVYPGHDYGEVPFRTLSEEAKLNPTLMAKTYSQFLRIP
jgi:glyoxylase-like metal-dependent hydrolase (beta-lactamase superfamily II)